MKNVDDESTTQDGTCFYTLTNVYRVPKDTYRVPKDTWGKGRISWRDPPQHPANDNEEEKEYA